MIASSFLEHSCVFGYNVSPAPSAQFPARFNCNCTIFTSFFYKKLGDFWGFGAVFKKYLKTFFAGNPVMARSYVAL